MTKFQKVAGRVHPANDPKIAKGTQTANKGKPTPNKNVKPLTKDQKYSGTT